MRARIIFKGLTLFTFSDSTRGAKAGANAGTLTAHLLSDPKHKGMPLHNHTPRLGFIGRDRGAPLGNGRAETKQPVAPVTTIELIGHGTPTGVTLSESFVDYVPCLSELHWNPSTGIREEFVTRRIVIPSGTIRAGDFIGWDWNGNTPARIAYMDTRVQGFGTNEVVVDVGDDTDIDNDYDDRYLSVTGEGVNERLWPRAKGPPSDEDIEPNIVEVVITNMPARRARAAPHGLHFQTTCDAAGYARRTQYVNAAQYNDFVAAMNAYDAEAWRSDVGAMGIGHPFPYLVDPRRDRLQGLSSSEEPARALVPPPPPGRRAGEGISAKSGDHMDHGGMAMGHDPENTQICPFGRE
jgi:hypothetical protein